ncbi:MAG: hypothetical protein N4A45_02860 [Flavobacteriales bacterium]|jgi:hypothetical protein|nr:hypothetical protein [Flavobacteriales bacterium]
MTISSKYINKLKVILGVLLSSLFFEKAIGQCNHYESRGQNLIAVQDSMIYLYFDSIDLKHLPKYDQFLGNYTNYGTPWRTLYGKMDYILFDEQKIVFYNNHPFLEITYTDNDNRDYSISNPYHQPNYTTPWEIYSSENILKSKFNRKVESGKHRIQVDTSFLEEDEQIIEAFYVYDPLFDVFDIQKKMDGFTVDLDKKLSQKAHRIDITTVKNGKTSSKSFNFPIEEKMNVYEVSHKREMRILNPYPSTHFLQTLYFLRYKKEKRCFMILMDGKEYDFYPLNKGTERFLKKMLLKNNQ